MLFGVPFPNQALLTLSGGSRSPFVCVWLFPVHWYRLSARLGVAMARAGDGGGWQTDRSKPFFLLPRPDHVCLFVPRGGLRWGGRGGLAVSVRELYLLSRSGVLSPSSLSRQIVLAKIFYLLQELLSFQHSKMSTSVTVPSSRRHL